MKDIRSGACMCGKIKFEYKGSPFKFTHCHCTMCQKFSGSPFGSFIGIKAENFRFTEGQELEKEYASSEWASRTFCSNCGSSLMYDYKETPDVICIAAGLIDGDVGLEAEKHIFVKDKCSWYEITDELPQIERY